MANPYCKSYTLAAPLTPYQLSALMEAVDPSVQNLHLHAVMMLQIQSSISNAAEVVVIGNSDVSAANAGVELYASQAFAIGFVGGNAIYVPNIWVMWVPTAQPPQDVRINVTVVVS